MVFSSVNRRSFRNSCSTWLTRRTQRDVSSNCPLVRIACLPGGVAHETWAAAPAFSSIITVHASFDEKLRSTYVRRPVSTDASAGHFWNRLTSVRSQKTPRTWQRNRRGHPWLQVSHES